ncbi:restriction endonuclease subunit S [Campylobacter upsaliensis]
MKTDTLKKSLLDYAIKGRLSAKFRRENSELNAFDELEIYNDKIKEKRKNLEKELKTLEFKLKKAPTRHCETSAESISVIARERSDRSNPQTKQELKSQIQILKKELTKCKEITPLNLSEAPFEIPSTWAWVKLGDICEIVSGGTPSRDKIEYWHNGTIPWVKIADVKNNVVNQTQEFITELGLENSSAKIFKKGTLLYTIFATLGETAILNIDAATNQAIAALIEAYDYDTKFLMYCLMSMKDYVNSLGRGVAQNNINQTMLKNFTIPLPPLREQQEIVSKLDLLVSLANNFAITKENLKRIEKRIEKSLLKLALEGSLSKLYRRSSPTLSAFDEINIYNDEIKQKRKDLEKELKKCEKELKLEKDREQKAFFKSQIQSLKKELTKCKEITPLNLSEAPFTIPNSWAWVKLGDICEIRLGKTPPRDTKIYWNSNDYQWVSIADMGESKILTQTKEHISQAGREKCFGDFIFKKGTLLLSFKLTIGKVAFLGFDGFHNEGIASVLPLLHAENEQIFKEFLFHFLPPLTQLCESTGAIKGETLNKQKLNNLSIPLPPLQEQEHITQILDTLFTLKKGLRVD